MMELDESQPGSPSGGPLQATTPDRINQQRESTPSGHSRDSSVHDKIAQFNTLSTSKQAKNLERKTADAALKRAVLGREEAEEELKRYREEVKSLRKAIAEGKERERRVGERLETIMENYGRAKETHAHTQALWEKEIRRARKESFKAQSTTVKLQEELKSSRSKVRSLEEALAAEKERSHVREQEAFTARYQIVGVQEQLEQALEKIKVVEQERDAFRTAAQNEEVARIAAEGRIPLPQVEDPEDEFASPKKMKKNGKRQSTFALAKNSRCSLSGMEVLSSEASELEIEELRFQLAAERARAERAEEMVEFLQFECQMHRCSCSKSVKSGTSVKSRSSDASCKQEHESSVIVHETPAEPMFVDDEVHVEEEEEEEAEQHEEPELAPPVMQIDIEEPLSARPASSARSPSASPPRAREAEIEPDMESEMMQPRGRKELRRSTIFCPKEGIFRTVSEQEAEALQMHLQDLENSRAEDYEMEVVDDDEMVRSDRISQSYARTPSVEPPAFAMMAQQRESLASLLNAPSGEAHTAPLPSMHNIPTMPDDDDESNEAGSHARYGHRFETPDEPEPRPHTTAANYSVTTTTTRVPVRDETEQLNSSFGEKLRTPSGGSNVSFDANNPALTPTMTREQALAKIRERRGRARSVEKKTTSTSTTSNDGGVAHKKTSADRVDRRAVSGSARKPSRPR